MEIKVSFNRDIFVNKFLTPLSRLSDRAVIKLQNGNIFSSVTSEDMSVTAYICINDNIPDECNLNINNLKKLSSLLGYISSNDFTLNIGDNYLKYSANDIRFKYHFLDDGIIKNPPINFEKVKTFETHISFELSADKIKELIRLSTVSDETKQKVYFSFSSEGIFAELTDKTLANCDSIVCKISDSYNGEDILDVPFSFSFLQILCQMKLDFVFKYNKDKSVAVVYSNLDTIEYIFISSSLVK